MLNALLGTAEIEMKGASPELCLNRLAAKGVPFRNPVRRDEWTVTCTIPLRWRSAAEREITAALCTSKLLRIRGLLPAVSGLKKRPVLILGTLLAFLLAFLAQSRIWFIRVESSGLPEERVLRALEAEGVRFGADAAALDTQWIKNRMLNRIPELRWLGVNRVGGIAEVSYSLRSPAAGPEHSLDEIANVTAARDGVVTQISVYNGFAAVEPGEAVREGQLLVSGFADWDTHTQATRAMADVEAMTARSLRLLTPATYGEKVYTGRTERCLTLIFERNRIKISGNSSIFGTRCDKMIEIRQAGLPGGYTLPLGLEIVTLREYRLEEAELTKPEAERMLKQTAEALVRADMIAGTIESKEFTIKRTDAAYDAAARFSCREIISRTSPVYLFGEEEPYGQNHQRRTNGADHQRLRLLR